MPEYNGVDVQHPRIVEYTKNMVKMGLKREEIMKRTGMPSEVVEKLEREAKQEAKREAK